MAKVIRPQWVFKKDNKWVRYLPRRKDGVIGEYDYKKYSASYEDFCETYGSSLSSPPKLWLAWLYRDPQVQSKRIRARIYRLFGVDSQPGKMDIFPNTPSYNDELWHIKHLIELKPLVFANGEPTNDDVIATEITPDGKCTVSEKCRIEESDLVLYDQSKQFSNRELNSKLNRQFYGLKDVFERNVYTPSNISVMK